MPCTKDRGSWRTVSVAVTETWRTGCSAVTVLVLAKFTQATGFRGLFCVLDHRCWRSVSMGEGDDISSCVFPAAQLVLHPFLLILFGVVQNRANVNHAPAILDRGYYPHRPIFALCEVRCQPNAATRVKGDPAIAEYCTDDVKPGVR